MELIQTANYASAVSFFEAYSYEVLPGLLAEGKQIDFAYIDSTKQFDWLLVDFFYIDKMLTTGGVLVFDDVNFPGIRKLIRLIAQFPNYKVYDVYPKRGLFRELLSSLNIFLNRKNIRI
jgi:predicted O-methyltransferase YrrM